MNENIKFTEIINESIDALELEISELKTTNRKGNNIYDGFFVSREKDMYLYLFKLNEEI
ncbi:MAG: hypothetical protein GX982_06700 [Tissierellia bacterium]|nr:hypothetical protein [Tissierellia bacterium]